MVSTDVAAGEAAVAAARGPSRGGVVRYATVAGCAEWTPAEVGAFGEDIAAAYLEEQAMTVLERNWRCVDGELDAIALDGDTVVFVEVKTRRGEGYGMPLEAVTTAKVRRLRRLAGAWLREQGWPGSQVRIDGVGVLVAGGSVFVEHIEGIL